MADVTDDAAGADSAESSPRMEQFQAEIETLKLDGGTVSLERLAVIAGAVMMVVGIVLSLLMWSATHGSDNPLEQADYRAAGTFSLVLAVVGTGLFLLMSLRRYLRYWLLRVIHELREQADRPRVGS